MGTCSRNWSRLVRSSARKRAAAKRGGPKAIGGLREKPKPSLGIIIAARSALPLPFSSSITEDKGQFAIVNRVLVLPLTLVHYAPVGGIRGLWAGPYLTDVFGLSPVQNVAWAGSPAPPNSSVTDFASVSRRRGFRLRS